MGYYTTYTLSIKNESDIPGTIYDDIDKYLKEHDDTFYAIEGLDGSADSAKWYDHDDDMIELSLHFSSVVFELYGEGEEAGDMWYKYYKDGKMQVCSAKIVFDPYDETKLE